MPIGTLRMTIPTQLVLSLLLTEPARERYGAQIGADACLASGTVHPILARLEGLGWLTSRWEDINPAVEGRPARRYYRLTPDGAQHAHHALAGAYQSKLRSRPGRPAAEAS
jgi:PadR family transcriptional regulator PadR